MVDYSKVRCPRCNSKSFYTRQSNKKQVCIKCGDEGDFFGYWQTKLKKENERFKKKVNEEVSILD